jgi:hypothetical protein
MDDIENLKDVVKTRTEDGEVIILSPEYISSLDIEKDDEDYYLDTHGQRIHFKNIVELKSPNTKINLSNQHILELYKCSVDYEYFYKNYVQVLTKSGYTRAENRSYQNRLSDALTDEKGKRLLVMGSRQSGKSVKIGSFILHKIVFTNGASWGIAANKREMAVEVLDKIKQMYMRLPIWMQHGVKTWNVTKIILDNDSKILTSATNGDSFRGFTFAGEGSGIMVDECAFIHRNKWKAFEDSVMPTISSDPNSQIIMCSTPKGLNHWYDLFSASQMGKNEFTNVMWDWTELPQAKDPSWKEKIINTYGPVFFAQNYGVSFIGSSNTLVESNHLVHLTDYVAKIKPIIQDTYSKIFERPQREASYVVTVDVAKGKEIDYHVANVTKLEDNGYFKQVAVYRNNTLSQNALPGVVNKIAREYNNALVFVEGNNGGDVVGRDLVNDFEYENLIRIRKHKKTKEPTPSLYGGEYGLHQSAKTKRKGCGNLKLLIETNKYEINDVTFVDELKRFVADENGNYSADSGHDDTVMSLVLFSWLIFEYNEFHDMEFRKDIKAEMERELTENTAPFVFFDNGIDVIQPGVVQHVPNF